MNDNVDHNNDNNDNTDSDNCNNYNNNNWQFQVKVGSSMLIYAKSTSSLQ